MLSTLKKNMKNMCLTIDVNKTKIIFLKRRDEKTVCNIASDGKSIEQVDKYVNLGSLFSTDRKIDCTHYDVR